ncbi:MAG: DinB family protein [Acidobacteriaceae bacterium]|nr:DinB family protein [Acidobacteriaceae bacterium]
MQNSDDDKLIAELDESASALRSAVADLSDEIARQRPDSERWSALENIEHLIIVEEMIRNRIAAAEPTGEPVHNPEREAQLPGRVALRDTRFTAPPVAWPRGRFDSVSVALEQFDATRRDTARFISEHGPKLRRVHLQHPVFGNLSGYEMVLVLAGHAHRHANQILEGIVQSTRF